MWNRLDGRASDGLTGPTVILGILTFLTQALTLGGHMVVATFVGAGRDADALFAALAIPQYATGVLASTTSLFLVPAFVRARARGVSEERRVMGMALLGCVALGLGTALAVMLAPVVLRITTPGLSAATLVETVPLARIVWPTVVAAGLAAVFAAKHQANGRFARPVVVQLVGAAVSLGLSWTFAPTYGAAAVAIGILMNFALQAAALAAGAAIAPPFPVGGVGVGGLSFVALIALGGALARSTIIFERAIASTLGEGSLSVVSYASRLASAATLVAASGIAAVAGAELSRAEIQAGPAEVGRAAWRMMGRTALWLFPGAAMLGTLAFPLVRVLFERGEFTVATSSAVAPLVGAYALAVAATVLAMITSRALVAAGRGKLVTVVGLLEVAGYVAYGTLLAHVFGVMGVAVAGALYAGLTLGWQSIVLARSVAPTGRALRPMLVALAGALGAAFTALVVARLASAPFPTLFVGGPGGLIAAALVTILLRRKLL